MSAVIKRVDYIHEFNLSTLFSFHGTEANTMGTLLECLREARLEKYYPSFRAQGITRSEALTRLTVHDCSTFGINSADDRRRLIQLIEIVKQVHSEGPYAGSGTTSRSQPSQQTKNKSARKRNRSPAITNNVQVQSLSSEFCPVGFSAIGL